MKFPVAAICLSLTTLAACGSEQASPSPPAQGGGGMIASGGTTVTGGDTTMGGAMGTGGDTAATGGDGTSGGALGTGGAPPSGGSTASGGSPETGGFSISGGAMGTGGRVEFASTACCDAHDTPGCDDKAAETCVCEKVPDCCATAWSSTCVEILRQRFCDPGVRECVCNPMDDSADPGWGQQTCCSEDWTQNICDVVATSKCSATIGCGTDANP